MPNVNDRVWFVWNDTTYTWDTGTVHAIDKQESFIVWDGGEYDTPEVVDGVTGEWFRNVDLVPATR